MRVDPLHTGEIIDLRPPDGKAQAIPPHNAPASPPASAPVAQKPAPSASALPVPERVSVSVDETRELVYKFVDAKTGEVLSQVPPEEVLRVVRGIQDLLRAEQPRKDQGVNVRG